MKKSYQQPKVAERNLVINQMLCISGNTDNPGGTISGGNQEPDDVFGMRNDLFVGGF